MIIRRIGTMGLAGLLIAAGAIAQDAGYDDRTLEKSVADAYARDATLPNRRLSVSVSGGELTVTGEVERLSEAWRARDLAAQIRGILAVRDQARISSAGIPDTSVAQSVTSAIHERGLDDSTRVTGLEVTASQGVITLRGALRDARTRFELRDVAAATRGVVGVEDRLTTPSQDDDYIRTSLLNIYAGKVDGRKLGAIDPIVDGGIVTLRGSVPLLINSLAATERAWGVNGVTGVVNQLSVEPRPPDSGVKINRP